LSGDVMTGRGIDQVLPQSSQPRLYEPFIRDAREYVRLAEAANGPIPRTIYYSYAWGDALAVLTNAAPDVRIINLETAVTTHARPWPRKGIHYRMHPANVAILNSALIDCCTLANNHILDWHYPGFQETLETLSSAQIAVCGAGRDRNEAVTPATFDTVSGHRIQVYGFATADSGTPLAWMADDHRPGISLLPDLSSRTLDWVSETIARQRLPSDRVVLSVHWGGNWGYTVPREHRDFAHALIDRGLVDLVHGHSSHHPRGIEVYRGRLVMYGCGDLINDYEGIEGHEGYRGDLSLLYLPRLRASDGELLGLTMVPMQIRRFRLHHAPSEAAGWLAQQLNREGQGLGTSVEIDRDSRLLLRWDTNIEPSAAGRG
jgi:poly-gamma-glutamate synthesis protein (capsule biosynthesis protein)